jgi:hypothetical protein
MVYRPTPISPAKSQSHGSPARSSSGSEPSEAGSPHTVQVTGDRLAEQAGPESSEAGFVLEE